MQPVATLVSLEEYLNTSYHPDCEYVDGMLVERSVGEIPHSEVLGRLIEIFGRMRDSLGTFALPEVRVQVKPERFRVPDVTVCVGARPKGRYFVDPPLLVIEILSKDDKFAELMEKIDDYRSFGVNYIWVIDPESKRAQIYTRDEIHEVRDGVLRTAGPVIEVPLAEILS